MMKHTFSTAFVVALSCYSASSLAAEFDLAGIKLGSDDTALKDGIAAFDPPLVLQTRRISGRIMGYQGTTAAISSSTANSSINLGGLFDPDGKVWFIGKAQRYEQGYRPTAESTLTALRQKYGEPSSSAISTYAFELEWQFDRSGNRYKGPSAKGPCVPLSAMGRSVDFGHSDNSVGFSAPGRFHGSCGVHVTATSSIKDGMIEKLTVFVYDSANQFDLIQREKAAANAENQKRLEEEKLKAVQPTL